MNKHWGDLVYEKSKSHGQLCVGIDPAYEDIPDVFKKKNDPADVLSDYVHFVLDTLKDNVGFVKFQSAFYEAFGSKGISVLAQGIAKAKSYDFAVILDAKRGDIGSTADAYAKSYLTPRHAGSFSDLEVDCLTINPFLGPETLEPFVKCAKDYGKGLFILAKTSNPGAGWIQDQLINKESISDRIAHLVGNWAEEAVGQHGLSSIGTVVGMTYPEDAKRLRAIMPHSIFLAPGLGGPQCGDPKDIIALQNADDQGVVASSSRGITKPSNMDVTLNDYSDLLLQRVSNFSNALKAASNDKQKKNDLQFDTLEP